MLAARDWYHRYGTYDEQRISSDPYFLLYVPIPNSANIVEIYITYKALSYYNR